ncbi:MAG: hypothetical protein ACI9A1_002056 [Lentimonas sp.]
MFCRFVSKKRYLTMEHIHGWYVKIDTPRRRKHGDDGLLSALYTLAFTA